MESMIEKYKKWSKLLQTEEERMSLNEATIGDVMNDLSVLLTNIQQYSTNEATENDTGLMASTELFRCLRNACAQCSKNQNLLSETDVMNSFMKLQEVILNPSFNDACNNEDCVNRLHTMSVQFLGNFIVQNHKTQSEVWKSLFPQLFYRMMTRSDEGYKEIICMIVYNCMLKSREIFTSDDGFWLLVSIMEHCKQFQHSEWGFLIIELILLCDDFESVYQQLADYPQLRCLLIDVAQCKLEDDCKCELDIPVANLLFLADQFCTKSTCVLRLAGSATDDQTEGLLEESLLIATLLSLLCTATSYTERFTELRKHIALLDTVVDLLKQVSSPELSNHFTEKGPAKHNKKSSDETDGRNPAAFSFKRDLVRLIGNMCYQLPQQQNRVRELDGLLPVLNCCNIDEKNPYIMQWAVFAVRNLCDTNQENQAIISSLERTERTEQLRTEDLQISVENGQIKISKNDN